MALKPIPRLILIVACCAAAGFGYYKATGTKPQVVATTDGMNQTIVQPPPMPAMVAGPSVANDTLTKIRSSGELNVSVQAPSLPFFSATGNGQAYGFNVDFIKLMLSNSDLKVNGTKFHGVDTYEEVPRQLLSNQKIDIAIDGLTFSDSDLRGVQYTVPYVDNFGYSLIGLSTAALRPDLSGATIGILKGDSDVKSFMTSVYPKANFVELSDASTSGQRTWIKDAITSGKVDAVVYDYPFAVAEIANTPLQFLVTKLPGSDIQYKIGIRSEDNNLKEVLDRAIRKVKASPEYGELIRKYFVSSNSVAVKEVTGGETTYTVKRGDTLSLIAGATLGNNMRYGEIETRNNLANPNLISVGQKLIIPRK